MPKPSTREPYHCEKCNVTVAIKEAHLRSKKHDPENYELRSSTRKLYHCDKCDCDVGNMCNDLKSKKHNPENYGKWTPKPKYTDEERRASKLASLKEYNDKKWLCELCGKMIGITSIIRHSRTECHKKFTLTKPDVNDTSSNSA